jgi:hypothetical protein
MTRLAALPPLSRAQADEIRAQVATRAAGVERSNRPTLPLAVAAAAFVVAAVLALVAVFRHDGAQAALAKARADATEIARLTQQHRNLEELARDPARERFAASGGQILSQIHAAGVAAGLQGLTQTPRTLPRAASGEGVSRTDYAYDGVRDPDLGRILTWIGNVIRDVPLIDVARIKIRPEPAGWAVDVTFSRWERTTR